MIEAKNIIAHPSYVVLFESIMTLDLTLENLTYPIEYKQWQIKFPWHVSVSAWPMTKNMQQNAYVLWQ
jgi:hypothetical protein